MAGLKRIPVLGNQVDKLLTASAQQLIGQAQLALKLLDWLLTELDFFVQIDEVRSWFWGRRQRLPRDGHRARRDDV